MARQDPGDLLSQLDHEPVGIEEVEGPVPPRPVHRAGEELDAKAPEPLGFGIDVLDEEEDLAGRPAVDGLTVDQVGSTCALEEPEPCLAGDELRIPSIAELESEPDRVPIERRRHIQIADVQDHMADALHRDYRCSLVLAGGARGRRDAVSGPRRCDRRRRRWADIYLRSSSGSARTTPR